MRPSICVCYTRGESEFIFKNVNSDSVILYHVYRKIQQTQSNTSDRTKPLTNINFHICKKNNGHIVMTIIRL